VDDLGDLVPAHCHLRVDALNANKILERLQLSIGFNSWGRWTADRGAVG
jgi:hypothetical protein